MYLFGLHHLEHLTKLGALSSPDDDTLRTEHNMWDRCQEKTSDHANTNLTSCCTLALPQRTNVPMKAMLLREAMSPLAVGCGEVDLEQGVVSPVRLDSSTERSLACQDEGQHSADITSGQAH